MSKEFKANQNQKLDNQELNDWLDSLDAVVENHGREGAKLILEKLEKRAKDLRVLYSPVPYSPYRNTISQYDQGIYPGDLEIEEKDSILKKVAMERIGKPEDIASTIFFLTQSKYITGQIINVDGGRFSF